MKKYIDAEELIADINLKIESIENCPFQLASFGEERKSEGKLIAYKDALSIIDSLQQEQPELPDNLDEAARDYGFSCYKRLVSIQNIYGHQQQKRPSKPEQNGWQKERRNRSSRRWIWRIMAG